MSCAKMAAISFRGDELISYTTLLSRTIYPNILRLLYNSLRQNFSGHWTFGPAQIFWPKSDFTDPNTVGPGSGYNNTNT